MAYDASFSNVKLLVSWDGTDGATSATDESASPHTLTFVGNAQIDTAQSVFGGASLLLDGTGDYVTTPDSADWDFSTGDFTVETFARFNAHATGTNSNALLSNYQNATLGWWLRWRSGFGLQFGHGDTPLITSSWTPSDGVTYHVAACRSGTNLRLFVEGVQVGDTATNSTNISGSTSLLHIGALTSVDDHFNGWIEETRITKGTARYTGTFTVPTEAFPSTGAAEGTAPAAQFGTVNAAYTQYGATTGATPSTTFGTPYASYDQVETATGAAPSTAFGTATVPFPQTETASGFESGTTFGTPSQQRICTATTIGRNTVIPQAYYPFAQTQTTTGTAGSALGRPISIRFTAGSLARTGLAKYTATTAIGQPTLQLLNTGQATGISPGTTFGTPGSDALARAAAASALEPATAVGTPNAVAQPQPSGWVSTVLGTPLAGVAVHPTGQQFLSTFGEPTLQRPDTYTAYGLRTGERVGHPVALRRFNKAASSVSPAATFGTAAALDIHRPTHIAPGAAFGEPLATRWGPFVASGWAASNFGRVRSVRGFPGGF